MNEARYKIVFNGLVMMETPEATVKANLARLFKCDPARIEPLFTGQTATLKRNLGEQEANRYVQVLREAGAIVHKELEPPAKSAAAPVALELVEKPEPAPQPAADAQTTSTAATNASTDPFDNTPAWAQARPQAQEPRPAYKSPTQELAELRAHEDDGGYCELDFISLEGRLGRLRYLAWSMAMWLLLIPVIMVGIFLYTKFPPLAILGAVVVGILAIAFNFTLTFRRLHDIDMSAWWILLTFAPLVSNFFVLFLLLKAGDDGDNDYGPPPPPNSIGVIVMAAGMLLLMALMIFGLFYL
ncbi:hypothetical protein AGMMS49545_11920 [Betaproteobacteria bacterium]|nr:hypothetical protein AGMMS49545_11920 [Betaproteobacteria bacterium]GHU47911.1 hypothetical protein AGMMS50289_23800 [Betaproteobacteria bacterium]